MDSPPPHLHPFKVRSCSVYNLCTLAIDMALFTMGTGGHYITMLPTDWSISLSHDRFALQYWYVNVFKGC